jgi:hypothetical protein
MVISSIVTGFLGIILLFMYQGTIEYYHVAVFYPATYLGILNLITCALSVVGAMALLKRRYFQLSLISILLLFASGFAAPIAWNLQGYILYNGFVMFGAPHVVLSSSILISWCRHNKAKRQLETKH